MPKRLLFLVNGYEGRLAQTLQSKQFSRPASTGGLDYSEALEAFRVFEQAGLDITVASESGSFQIDPFSVTGQALTVRDLQTYANPQSSFNRALTTVRSVASVQSKQFDAVYISSGRGALLDFPKARAAHQLVARVFAQGGVIGAVSHGTVILAHIEDTRIGDFHQHVAIVYKRVVTGFSDEAEQKLGCLPALTAAAVRTSEQALRAARADFVAAPRPMAEFCLADDRIVTGANCASARLTASRVVDLMDAEPVKYGGYVKYLDQLGK